MCAELIWEFLEFYSMKYSLQVFLPEMSLGVGRMPRGRHEIEREVGIGNILN